MEVLLGSFDGFMQNCDFQIDSFRAHLLEFLKLQVSGTRDPPRRPAVCPRLAVPAGGRVGPRSLRSLFLEPRFSPLPTLSLFQSPNPHHVSLGGVSLLGFPTGTPALRSALLTFLPP